jgi:hypothetical protein
LSFPVSFRLVDSKPVSKAHALCFQQQRQSVVTNSRHFLQHDGRLANRATIAEEAGF